MDSVLGQWRGVGYIAHSYFGTLTDILYDPHGHSAISRA